MNSNLAFNITMLLSMFAFDIQTRKENIKTKKYKRNSRYTTQFSYLQNLAQKIL